MKSGIVQPLRGSGETELAERVLSREFGLREIVGRSAVIRAQIAQARRFAAQGFEWLHVVDLDGAFAGKPINASAVEGILAGVTMKVQLGGGVRDMKTVNGWLEKGVARVIIGTAAVEDPAFGRSGSWKPASSRRALLPRILCQHDQTPGLRGTGRRPP